MNENENSVELQAPLRTNYLKSISGEFYKAEARHKLHLDTMALVEKNYKGEMRQKLEKEENSQYAADIGKILQNIDSLAAHEADRLTGLKRDEVANTSEKEISAINRIDKLADILTKEELQLMADEFKDYPLVQRKLSRVSSQKGVAIDTYPGTDKKLEIVQQSAADIKAFISSRDFGLTPSIYFKISFLEYDAVLSPAEKREAEDDNT